MGVGKGGRDRCEGVLPTMLSPCQLVLVLSEMGPSWHTLPLPPCC